ncbi:MAG: hypothetical protein VXZ96_18975 [Myxococcota bacterium]|nr:hypothetical protein [Myxococcota bacterium]
MKKRVLIGSVLNNDPTTLSAFFQALSQIKKAEHQVAFAFIGVRLTPLSQLMVRLFLFRHPGFVETHYIQKEALQSVPQELRGDWHFALSRNRLIQEAIECHADAALLVEVDTPLRPETLTELLDTEYPWIDKLVFDGDHPLASPTVAQPIEDIDPHFFDAHEFGTIASAGSCMLLQGDGLSPVLRYQFFHTLGLPRPDQHLAIRAIKTGIDRIIDTRHPLQKRPKVAVKPGSLKWFIEGACALLGYTPTSTGKEGVSYLCEALRAKRLADAPQLAKEFQSAQISSHIHVVSAEQNSERDDQLDLFAIQELQTDDQVEHHILVIHVLTVMEDTVRTINGIEVSTLLESELPTIQGTKKQRYAIPPIDNGPQQKEAKEHTQHVDASAAKMLKNSVSGLKVYRLPN